MARLRRVLLRAVLIGTSTAVLLVALVFGPAWFATVTGRPFVLDCGDASPAQCEEALKFWARDAGRKAGEGPITYFKFEPYYSEGICGQFLIERGTFTFGLFNGTGAEPYCGP